MKNLVSGDETSLMTSRKNLQKKVRVFPAGHKTKVKRGNLERKLDFGTCKA